jgi:hypothetical protein
MRIAQTTTVITPIGAVPRRIPSAHPIDVARNCFVVSSPNKINKGARSVKRLLAKFPESSWSGVAVALGDDPVRVAFAILTNLRVFPRYAVD